MKTTSLEEILAKKPMDTPPPDSEGEGEMMPDNGETEAEALLETPEEETPAENAEDGDEMTTPKAGDSKEVKGLKAALLAERAKRQKLETMFYSSSPDAEEDDDEASLLMKKIDHQENLMRDMHDDYDEAMTHFYELIDADSSGELQKQLNEAKNPVVFAYKTGKGHWDGKITAEKEAQAKKEEELRARIRKEVEAEYETKNRPKPAKTLPDGGTATVVEVSQARKPLSDIIGR